MESESESLFCGSLTDEKDKYQAESTSLREKMRKQLESIEDLVETLCSAAQDVSEPVSSKH